MLPALQLLAFGTACYVQVADAPAPAGAFYTTAAVVYAVRCECGPVIENVLESEIGNIAWKQEPARTPKRNRTSADTNPASYYYHAKASLCRPASA